MPRNLGTQEYDVASADRASIEYFIRLGLADERFVRVVVLAHEIGWNLEDTVMTLHVALGPLPRLDWRILGNPSQSQCAVMAAAITELADTLERNNALREGKSTSTDYSKHLLCFDVKLLSVALFHSVLPGKRLDVVRVLGLPEVVRRLREFANVLTGSALIS